MLLREQLPSSNHTPTNQLRPSPAKAHIFCLHAACLHYVLGAKPLVHTEWAVAHLSLQVFVTHCDHASSLLHRISVFEDIFISCLYLFYFFFSPSLLSLRSSLPTPPLLSPRLVLLHFPSGKSSPPRNINQTQHNKRH